MPGAFDHITRERPLVQGTASMGTGRKDGAELLTLAQQDDWHSRFKRRGGLRCVPTTTLIAS